MVILFLTLNCLTVYRRAENWIYYMKMPGRQKFSHTWTGTLIQTLRQTRMEITAGHRAMTVRPDWGFDW